MNDEDINEILLLLLRQYRAQAEIIDELGATLHGVRDLVVGDNENLAKKLENLEAESKAATALPKRMTLQKLDGIIRKLESIRPHRRTN